MNDSATAYEARAANDRRVSDMQRARAAAPVLARLLPAAAYIGIALALVAALMLGPPPDRGMATMAGEGSPATGSLLQHVVDRDDGQLPLNAVALVDGDTTPTWLCLTSDYGLDVVLPRPGRERAAAGDADTRMAASR